jgi:hypothetical protein
MKTSLIRTLIVLLALASVPEIWAFPPAPHHLFYGMVRDQYGTPIETPGALVVLVSANGKQVSTLVNPGVQPGVNYKLEVPMDAGLTSDLYKATAMKPTMPFQIFVIAGGRTNLPIELKGDFAQMGKPGKQTRMDLTLGEDTDGDGLPDAWERLINRDITKVNPNDQRGNGLSNLQEYLAGIYPANDSQGFRLAITQLTDGQPVMNFMGVQGRYYTVLGSSDLNTWTPVTFRIPAIDDASAAPRAFFQATDIDIVEIQAITNGPPTAPLFFKLMVQ